jgi:rhodanese-related sulfurtransferase
MNTVGIIIAVIVIMGGIYMFNKNRTGASDALSFRTVQSDIAGGGQLIDVRSRDEYDAGHINGAVNLDVQAIQAGSLPSVAKTQKIYVYCRSGARSGQATSILKSAGYQNIVNLGAMAKVQSIGGSITN